MTTAAIVLAAGQSTRMGAKNKLLLPFRHSTVVASTVDAVAASGVAETVVVVGHQAEQVRAALVGKPVRFVLNPDHADGMGASIHAGIQALGPETDAVMVCLSDLPLVEPAELNRLMQALEQAPGKTLAVPTYQSRRGNPVLFSMAHREEILTVRGAVGSCKGLVRRYPEQVLEVPMETDHVLCDIDTLENYQALLARVGTPPQPSAAAAG